MVPALALGSEVAHSMSKSWILVVSLFLVCALVLFFVRPSPKHCIRVPILPDPCEDALEQGANPFNIMGLPECKPVSEFELCGPVRPLKGESDGNQAE